MTYVDAIYQEGVFRPLGPVNLPEQQRVRLSIESFDQRSVEQWLADLEKLHAEIKKRVGVLPDSAPDIAADRLRDI